MQAHEARSPTLKHLRLHIGPPTYPPLLPAPLWTGCQYELQPALHLLVNKETLVTRLSCGYTELES